MGEALIGDLETRLIDAENTDDPSANGRVELLFPVEDERLKQAIRDDILLEQLDDSVRSRRLLPDGSYERLQPEDDAKPLDCQKRRLARRGSWHIED